MKNISGLYPVLIILISLFSCKAPEYLPDSSEPAQEKNGFELVWAEEFNEGNKPIPKSWSYEYGFIRNEELQWYQDDNARIKNGVLIIEGKREEIKNPNYDKGSSDWRKNRKYANYSSSSINTRGKKEFQYGIIEVRARINTARGNWPAIWTLGVEKPWPANGEVDIMEYYMVNNEPHILANAAWKGSEEYVNWDSEKIPFGHFLDKDPKWTEKFHIWKMQWTEEYIRLYLDDELLNEIDLGKTTNPDGFNPFHQPHYILLNLALGSNGGNPSTTEFPQYYEVDYVRVYQKK
ncbi:glycoside hydrolase family 16 protein [Christiangramia crocea]|uniref:Glycoside hydrolase family 16 protein n=1 Tax=Christiangramia crocea TaxID=2904124 RepID=A0A9X2A8E6_9FLAO|nr:glycoside hydrolase family 16 protein [Gramella crocea]MCG9972856.1 glycoside hydrolase family 16 protein [Gramella crocea]